MRIYSVTTEGAEALAAATAETLLQLRGVTTTRANLIGWGVSFDGVTAGNTPVLVRLAYQTTDGTMSAASEVPYDPSEGTALLTAFHTSAGEPTLGSILEEWYVHPNGGSILREYLPNRGPIVAAATSSRLAIVVNALQVVNAVAFMTWEE